MSALGDVINYTDSAGSTTQLSAIIDRRVERVGADGYTIQHRTEIEFLISALAIYPSAGDTIMRNSETFIVESVLHDDGHYIRLAIK